MSALHDRLDDLLARLPSDWSPNPGTDCDGHLDLVGQIMQAGMALGVPAWKALDIGTPLDSMLGP